VASKKYKMNAGVLRNGQH